MKASGSALRVEMRKMMPQKVPGSRQYFSSVQLPFLSRPVVGPFHRAPAEIAVVALARHVHVDARPVHRLAGPQLQERFLLHADAIRHGEEAGDVVIVDDEHDVSQCWGKVEL